MDNDPFNKPINELEPYSEQDKERAFGRTVVSKMNDIIEMNPATVRRIFSSGIEIESVVRPSSGDLTLQRLGYSKVSMSRVVERDAEGNIIFPIDGTIMTYDREGRELLTYDISEQTPIDITVRLESDDAQFPVGFDMEHSDELTFDADRMEREDESGFIPGQRSLTRDEQLELRSVLDICKQTLVNQKPGPLATP